MSIEYSSMIPKVPQPEVAGAHHLHDRQNGAGSGPPRKNVAEPELDTLKESGWNHRAG